MTGAVPVSVLLAIYATVIGLITGSYLNGKNLVGRCAMRHE